MLNLGSLTAMHGLKTFALQHSNNDTDDNKNKATVLGSVLHCPHPVHLVPGSDAPQWQSPSAKLSHPGIVPSVVGVFPSVKCFLNLPRFV